MYPARYKSPLRLSVICCLLSYILAFTLFASLPAGRIHATPAGPGGTGKAKHVAPTKMAQTHAPRRDGELIVRFREGVSEQSRSALAAARGARRRGRLRGESRIERLELPPGQNPAAVAELLRQQPEVELVEPNFIITRAQAVPNDARFSEQWALRNEGQTGGTVGSDVGASAAWRTTTGTVSTVVAVVDSGVDFSHPDLRNNRWENRQERDNNRDDDHNGYTNDLHGWDWVTDSGTIRDEHGHGTSVAGIVAARGDNRTGISGVMWRASVMSLRVLDAAGTGDVADAVEAIDYAVAQGAQVVNCSWGMEAESQALRDAIERAGRRGVVVIASAGNNSRDLEAQPYFPASYDLPNLIAVAATDQFDNLASFSNWGGTRVAVGAPGANILTTKMGGDYWQVSGTSASAPLVSGIAGLVKSVRPWLSAAAMRQAIIDGARRVDVLAGRVASGGVASASGTLGALSGVDDPFRGGGGPRGQTPRPADPGHGRGNRRVTAPSPTSSAPAGGPDLNELRDRPNHLPESVSAPISANFPPVCDDCYEDAGADPEFSTARSKPENETGQEGEDLGSRNFNWGLPLVSLPGRSGFDLDLALFYNSLVWTKQQTPSGATKIQFNPDNGFPGVGFRLGFPIIQKPFIDQEQERNAYIMVTPSGGRVKLFYKGATTGGWLYESEDGTYTQMVKLTAGGARVLTTDGTQYGFFDLANGEKRCHQIKDRNGNFITITYGASNRVSAVTDTLGRVVNFIYYADGNLYQLTQSRGGSGHSDLLVQFEYGTKLMQPTFAQGIIRLGPYNESVAVLSKVRFPDDSFYQFHYTTYGQVWKIEHRAPDTHVLSYTAYNLPGSDYVTTWAPQADCPRFTERRDWIEYGVITPEQQQQSPEVVTTYSENSQSICNQAVLADGTVPCKQVTAPDGTIYKEFFETSGWKKGLSKEAEVWSGGVRRKRTTVSWTHDGASYAVFPVNQRVAATNVWDEGDTNRRRTTIDYTSYSLPTQVREYSGADGQTFHRLTTTSYRLDAAYVDRRIIGLLFDRQVHDAAGMVSKVIYHYDWAGEHLSSQAPSTQHDAAGYPASFVVGRGNLTGVRRYDITASTDESKAVWLVRTGYNLAGSPVFTQDGAHGVSGVSHRTSISYTDSFSDAGKNSLGTLAYPTLVTDSEGYQSKTMYNYATGAVMETERPSSGTLSAGNVTYERHAMLYDWLGRLQRVTNTNTGFYTRWEYTADSLSLRSFRNIRPGSEDYFVEVYDGAGRVRRTAGYMPGTTDRYGGQLFFYDLMGRMVKWSNPTETTGTATAGQSWPAAGDDAPPGGAGWVYTSRTYDWQGRTLITTSADALTTELSYDGCGCAGGEVVTARDERGRRRKLYKDALGRLSKVEEINYDDSVYSTARYAYNARDQIESIRHYQGTEASGVFQQRTLEYDGHGRLWKRTTPEQGTTEFAYNADDTTLWTKDARGVKTTFTYSGRHLVTLIDYDTSNLVPGQSVAPTADVTMEYDAAGNRTRMTDALGTATYHYDSLSRMDWEERTFDGTGPFHLAYTYDNAGLSSVSTPTQWASQVVYSRDHTGAVTSVTGSGVVSAPVYANSYQYRAFGGLKSARYGNNRTLSVSYDNRLRVKTWEVGAVTGWEYSYGDFAENTGRVTYAKNLFEASLGQADPTLDRSYDYDQVGRLFLSYTGTQARAHAGRPGGNWGVSDGPYAQAYHKDAWGNLTQRDGWGGSNPSATSTYTNNRRNGWGYDLAGNLTSASGHTFTYDATGQQASAVHTSYNLAHAYDGDRLRVKKVEGGTDITCYLRSSVLGGQVVSEIKRFGATWWGLSRGYVYGAGGELLAVQYEGQVRWAHQDPYTKSQRFTDTSGGVTAKIDLDPWGGETARSVNSSQQSRKYTTYERDVDSSDEAMMRRYRPSWARFDQPDPADFSYDLSDPQSFNRYAYVNNDPVNLTDPSGLQDEFEGCTYDPTTGAWDCGDVETIITSAPRWSEFDAQLYWQLFILRSRFSEYRGGNGAPRPAKRQYIPYNYEYTACIGPSAQLCVGCIFDDEGMKPTVGVNVGPSTTVSIQGSKGEGNVAPGPYLTGSFVPIPGAPGLGFSAPLNRNFFKDASGSKATGTPQVGIGVQLVSSRLRGTTEWDWEHHPDNPKRKGLAWRSVGRCPY